MAFVPLKCFRVLIMIHFATENIFDIEIAQADKWYISKTQLSLSSPYMMIQYETRRLS